MNKPLALVDDPLFSRHRADGPHPERPERLDAARAAVAQANLPRRELEPHDATEEQLGRVHRGHYLQELGRVAGKRGHLDADTYYCPDSVSAAIRAAGGAVAMVDALRGGEAGVGLALLRPPGHHARPDRAMGFCLLNNVAVAAAHARAKGAERVVVVDWDVHHGNGTQEMFYDDPSVLYVSLHQWPFYPGTGRADEVGSGEGRGYTLNVPLSAGAGDAVYTAAFDRIIAPVIEQYAPDLVLISAGYDAHERDPLASMELTDGAYAVMLHQIARAMPGGPFGRLGVVLEGGYDLAGLSGALAHTLRQLEHEPDGPPDSPPSGLSRRHEAELARAASAMAPFWKLP